MEPTIGETMVFAETKCPCCGADPKPPLAAFNVEKIWDGRKWVVLESYEGGWLARRLAGRSVEPIPQS